MSESDKESVRLCLDGHPEAFERLVERYQGPIVGYLSGRLGDRERAEEAAQETFVRSYFALSTLRKPEAFYSWLFGIADRVAKEEQRRRRRQEDAHSVPQERAVEETPNRDLDVERAVARLGAAHREAILLRYYGGLSCEEISKRLEVPLGTVTKRLSRAYAVLRDKLKRAARDVGSQEAPK